MEDRWFWRQVVGLVCGLGIALLLVGLAVGLAVDSEAWWSLALGILGGLVPLGIEVTRRGGKVFLHDRDEVQARIAKDKALRWAIVGPAVLLAAVAGSLAGSVRATICAALGAYTLPVMLLAAGRFVFDRDEVRRLTS